MSDHGVRLRYGVALVLGLVCASAALAGGPLFPAQQYDAGDIPWCVAVGDLNGDESLDLVVAYSYMPGGVAVLLNNGDGTFAGPLHYRAGAGPRSVALADLNGDDWLDLAASHFWDDSVTVLLSYGLGLPGDVDDDGDVDWADLLALLEAYGACEGDASYDANADLDRNGCINLCDLARLLSNFGAGT